MKRLPLLLLSGLATLSMLAQDIVVDLASYHFPAGGYSGITPLGGKGYAVVCDNSPTLWLCTLDMEARTARCDTLFTAPSALTDLEDLCFDTRDTTLWLASEGTQRIAEMRFDGTPTGRELTIPVAYNLAHIQANRGFEALAYDSLRHSLWTATETNVRADSTGHIDLLAFPLALDTFYVYPYQLDAPQARHEGKSHYHGIAAITPLPDGTLLVLEREAYIKTGYLGSCCWIKIFRVRPSTGEKTLVKEWKTSFGLFDLSFANYEGMCIENLADEAATLLLVADSQRRYGVGRWHLKDYLRRLTIALPGLRR